MLPHPDIAQGCRNPESYPRDPALHGCLLSDIGGDSVWVEIGRGLAGLRSEECLLGELRLGGRFKGLLFRHFLFQKAKRNGFHFAGWCREC